MNYTELRISFDEYILEHAEILMAELAEMNFESFEEKETGFIAYIDESLFNKDDIEVLRARYPGIPFRYETGIIENINWNEAWEKNFAPILVRETCYIRAPFHPPLPEAAYEIIIEPKMSFGTGHHATTSLMIELLLETDCAQKTVLDMGCGTGVLGILARMRNALHVDFVDNDDWAFLNTAENCGRNDITGYDIFKGSVEAVPGDKLYDIILANINRNILLEQTGHYAKWLKKGGWLLLSGILKDDMEAIRTETSAHKLEYRDQKCKQDWLAMVFRK